MDKKELIEKWKENYHKEKIALLKIKINRIQEDITQLKSENRHASDKLNGMEKSVRYWSILHEEDLDNTKLRNCVDARIRDLQWMFVLCKLKIESNGKLIRKHRAKIKELRTELSVYELLSKDI